MRTLAAVLLAIAAQYALPIQAAEQDRQAAFLQDFRVVQALDARVHGIGWRLRAGNAPWCSDLAADAGLLVQDAGAYARADALRAALKFEGDIFVQAIAPGSPAAAMGVTPLTVLDAIEGRPMSDLALSEAEPWSRLVLVERMLEPAAGAVGSITLMLSGKADPVTVQTRPTCRTKFEIVSEGESLGADGQRVRVGRGFPGLAYPEEELAAALAHELAHNILRHPQWLAAHGRKRRDVRASEREADRLMPWLLVNAGYPPEAAVRFMRKWGPRNDGGLFRKRTHDGWDERAELIEAELPIIAQALSRSGRADWTAHFTPREIS